MHLCVFRRHFCSDKAVWMFDFEELDSTAMADTGGEIAYSGALLPRATTGPVDPTENNPEQTPIVSTGPRQTAEGEADFDVNERKLTIKELLNGAQDGTLVEMFGTGTAAIVSPVGNIFYDGVMKPLPVPEADNSFAQR